MPWVLLLEGLEVEKHTMTYPVRGGLKIEVLMIGERRVLQSLAEEVSAGQPVPTNWLYPIYNIMT
jgi:hypothetical protein